MYGALLGLEITLALFLAAFLWPDRSEQFGRRQWLKSRLPR